MKRSWHSVFSLHNSVLRVKLARAGASEKEVFSVTLFDLAEGNSSSIYICLHDR
jgi:hypothetical protein